MTFLLTSKGWEVLSKYIEVDQKEKEESFFLKRARNGYTTQTEYKHAQFKETPHNPRW